jgi:hypothetical protein
MDKSVEKVSSDIKAVENSSNAQSSPPAAIAGQQKEVPKRIPLVRADSWFRYTFNWFVLF